MLKKEKRKLSRVFKVSCLAAISHEIQIKKPSPINKITVV